jgi:hypothetical protein
MGAAAWTRELARSFRPGCTEARAAQRALALSGPSTASERTPPTGRLPVPCQSRW